MSRITRIACLGLAVLALLAATPAASVTKKKAARAGAARSLASSDPGGVSYAGRADALALAEQIAQQQQLDVGYVRKAIASARQLPTVAKLIMPAASPTAKNWQLYRSRFLDAKRIKAGAAFWTANAKLLQRAEREYGVPAEIIVGVIGVETLYGQQMGKFRVLDALTTLSLDLPTEHPRHQERRDFFQSELAQFLKLARQNAIDPAAWRGSYAGAMGMPQFMPSSWRRFAVDFDGDGRIDLFRSRADVIGSVAHYFRSFNWQSGMATHFAVSFDPATLDKDALLAPDILPTFDLATFNAKGALLEPAGQAHRGRLALIELRNGTDEPQYLAGTDNFYAITRYNWSSYYAMAVIELGQAVARHVQQAP